MRISKSTRRKIVLSLFILISYLISHLSGLDQQMPTIKPPAAPGYYTVLGVEDGDTITVDMNGTSERVRFIGIDTPETRDPRKPVQCFGKAASRFTAELIGDQDVRLESDPLSSNRDRYDRLLRYIYLPDDRLVQAEILKAGYGFAYTSFPFTKSDEFLDYQRRAREEERGLWSACEPTPNSFGGYNSNPE